MEQLLSCMSKKGIQGMFISRPVNVNYVSHYTGADAYLLITEQEKFFITDPRYTEQASIECPDYTLIEWRNTYGTVAAAVNMIAETMGLKAIGFEDTYMT